MAHGQPQRRQQQVQMMQQPLVSLQTLLALCLRLGLLQSAAVGSARSRMRASW